MNFWGMGGGVLKKLTGLEEKNIMGDSFTRVTNI